jgi:hypothetical protein
MSPQKKSEFESRNDVWEVQTLIREVYGMGDDLM